MQHWMPGNSAQAQQLPGGTPSQQQQQFPGPPSTQQQQQQHVPFTQYNNNSAAPAQQQQQQQQQQQPQPFLPPWYRMSAPQGPQQQQPWTAGANNSSSNDSSTGGNRSHSNSQYGAAPSQWTIPGSQANPTYSSNGPWGGASNGSSNGSSSTGYSNALGPPPPDYGWRSSRPAPYHGNGYGGGARFGEASGGSSGGRGYGGRGGGRGGRGSPSPHRAPSPPVWIKQDCWLVPKPGSVEAAAHAAAVAKHRQQQKQLQQQQAGQSPIAPAAAAIEQEAAAVAAVAAAAADESTVIDLTASDDEAAAVAAGDGSSRCQAAAAAAAAVSPSRQQVIDLSSDVTIPSPTTAVAGQLSGLQLLLQQHRQQHQHETQQQTLPQAQQQQQTVLAAAAPPPPRVVYIMRGLPGSGKSTRAAQIAAEAKAAPGLSSSVQPVSIHSTDSYFVNPATGVYTFNPDLLSQNHQRNFEAFCASLAAGVGTIILDNTNLQPWQYEKYVQQAWSAGYRVREEVVGEFTPAAVQLYAQRNVHGVPLDKLHIMLEQWHRQ